ncbi:MAG: hypothetical protein EOO22_05925 [Comamonadaceae bacterium]|nr:MAG: hypothetical protein EOO22_05925 [Comamonadaceae bacterium]
MTRARTPAAARARSLTAATLSRWPFPPLGEDTDKESRGRVLIVAGSHEIPGAALLAGVAALRAGAGKLAIAAPERVAIGLALAIPEARVIGVAEARSGGFDARGCRAIEPVASRASAVVLGPGMLDERRSQRFVAALLPMAREATVVLDAYAMAVVDGPPFEQAVILTPHAGEMAHLTGLSKEAVNADFVLLA